MTPLHRDHNHFGGYGQGDEWEVEAEEEGEDDLRIQYGHPTDDFDPYTQVRAQSKDLKLIAKTHKCSALVHKSKHMQGSLPEQATIITAASESFTQGGGKLSGCGRLLLVA